MRENMEDVRELRFKGCADLTAFHWQFPGEGGGLGAVDVLCLCVTSQQNCVYKSLL